jgi:hypothetical protein
LRSERSRPEPDLARRLNPCSDCKSRRWVSDYVGFARLLQQLTVIGLEILERREAPAALIASLGLCLLRLPDLRGGIAALDFLDSVGPAPSQLGQLHVVREVEQHPIAHVGDVPVGLRRDESNGP